MSRVPADTVLLRFLVAATLAATVVLAGCGGDDPETASTPASTPAAASTPNPAPPIGTTDTTPTTPDAGAGESPQDAPDSGGSALPPGAATGAGADSAPADTKETAAKASPSKKSNDEIASDMKKVYDALKENGLDPGKPIVSGEESGALQIKDTTIIFFPSPRQAAEASARFSEALKDSPQFVEVARKANRLFLMSLPTKPSDAQLENFRKVRKIANAAV